MSAVTRKPSVSKQDGHPRSKSPSLERLNKKMIGSTLNSASRVNWDNSRVITPGESVGYRTPLGLKFVNGSMKVFFSGNESQGLILEKGKVIGDSVKTTIKTQTARKAEKKATFIQYDKDRIHTEGADFKVEPTNKLGQVNYQGGHLIDHKFSAENSHTSEANYFPQHYKVNAPLKEYLVTKCDTYVEMLIYTPHPPKIGVLGRQKLSHDIPIGEVIIQIRDNKIEDVYYFPNNAFNYDVLQKKLGIRNRIAENLIPYFKLRRCFHPLFQCAMITDFKDVKKGKQQQLATEKRFYPLAGAVTFGMSADKCGQEESRITKVAFQVIQERRVDPSLLFKWSEEMKGKITSVHFKASINALGDFLVRYVLRNALKSEVISINTRLVFLNVIIDFMEPCGKYEAENLAFVDTLAPEFEKSFQELEEIKNTLKPEELSFLAATYFRLCDTLTRGFLESEEYKIGFETPKEFFLRLINVLRLFVKKAPIESLKGSLASRTLDLLAKVDMILGYCDPDCYFSEDSEYEDNFTEAEKFLYELREPAVKLFMKEKRLGRVDEGTFESTPGRITTQSATLAAMKKLGLSDSDEESD